MRFTVQVQNDVAIGTAWCDVPEDQCDLPYEKMLERYVGPAFAAALNRSKEESAKLPPEILKS